MGERSDNNFDALRLGFASGVAVYHLAVLSGVAAWAGAAAGLAVVAELCVQGFFVLSGHLVWASLQRSTSLADYAEKRARRLLPAYVVVIAVCALAALVLVPQARADLAGVARYLAANLVFLNFLAPELPGVFADSPMRAVNGALWTLKVEVMFYAALPLIAWGMKRAPAWAVLGALYCAGETWRLAFEALALEGFAAPLAYQLPGQMSFFVAGIALHWMTNAIERRPAVWGAAGAVLLIASLIPALEPLRAAGLALTIVWLARHASVRVPAARFGDLSYGVYITHFPIIQTLAAAGLFTREPELAGAFALVATAAAAFLLWSFVERPALRADSAYRRGQADARLKRSA